MERESITDAELEDALEHDRVDALGALISRGFSVDCVFAQVDSGRPPLLHDKCPIISFAAFYKAEQCFRFLLQNGAKLRVYDSVFFSFMLMFFFQFPIPRSLCRCGWPPADFGCVK
jgi:hypothetical protein